MGFHANSRHDNETSAKKFRLAKAALPKNPETRSFVIPFDQIHGVEIDGELGDCWRACVASLLDVQPLNLPHFAKMYGLDAMTFQTDIWLKHCGKRLRFLEPPVLKVCEFTADGTWHHIAYAGNLPKYVIVGGFSDLRNATRHSVVSETSEVKTWLASRPDRLTAPPFVHDPHSSRMGIVVVKNIWAILDA